LDGYEAVAPIAVVYDNAARRQGRSDIEPICIELAGRNMPFTVVIAGDDWLDYRLDADELASFRAVIVTQGTSLDGGQQALIDKIEAEGRLVVWPNDNRLEELVPAPVVVRGSQHVGIVPRTKPGDDAAPAVVHLLNRNYDGQNDRMIPQRDFSLRLRRDLLPGRQFTKATLHRPKHEPQPLRVVPSGEHTSVEVSELTVWAIVELGS
jgi:hypothetical protein